MMDNKDKILQWLNDYKLRTDCKGVVVGISGGKDSTTVAMLAKKVWGDNVLGVLMPNGVQADLKDSLDIVKTLKLNYKVVDIGEIYRAFLSALDAPTGQALINIAPRIRMTVLYALAQSLGYRVIGTGNASERYIGWFTKWGDGAFDFNPIASLTCTEVIETGLGLCEEFGLDKKYIVKTPADGLTGKSDEENFGFTYAQLDKVIKCSSDKTALSDVPPEIVSKIERLNRSSEHKRKDPEIFG